MRKEDQINKAQQSYEKLMSEIAKLCSEAEQEMNQLKRN
jgi:hypothetical protein|tara:strand:- start:46 stop:162 length:117 start_codon:yes stop_codon:yes gene_type:complete